MLHSERNDKKNSKQLQINALLCLVSFINHIIFFFVCDSVLTFSLKKRNIKEDFTASFIDFKTDFKKAINYLNLFKHADRVTVIFNMLKDKLKDVIWINNHIEKIDNLK